MGWSTFYGKTISQYSNALIRTGSWDNVYGMKGTLEYEANFRMGNIKF